MLYFERIEAARSDADWDEVWIQILTLEDDTVERAHLILPLLLWIDVCW